MADRADPQSPMSDSNSLKAPLIYSDLTFEAYFRYHIYIWAFSLLCIFVDLIKNTTLFPFPRTDCNSLDMNSKQQVERKQAYTKESEMVRI